MSLQPHRKNNNIKQPDRPELRGLSHQLRGTHCSSCICIRGLLCQASRRGEVLGPLMEIVMENLNPSPVLFFIYFILFYFIYFLLPSSYTGPSSPMTILCLVLMPRRIVSHISFQILNSVLLYCIKDIRICSMSQEKAMQTSLGLTLGISFIQSMS